MLKPNIPIRFDEDCSTSGKELLDQKASNSIWSGCSTSPSPVSNRHDKAQAYLHPFKENPFDKENREQNEHAIGKKCNDGRIIKPTLRNRATSLRDSAIKAVRKLKYQAHKLTESGRAKKNKPRNLGSRSAKARGNKLGEHETRRQLLGNGGNSRFKTSVSSHAAGHTRYDNPFLQGADLESKNVQLLETYTVQISQEISSRIYNCLKVAEDVKEDATRTLIALHQQGEQIRQTHEVAVEIDQDLSGGEKLLGSVGGLFSKAWKPKKTRTITGPVVIRYNPSRRRTLHLQRRLALGLNENRPTNRTSKFLILPGQLQQLTTRSKLEAEKVKQNDALFDLSNILQQLKEMSKDMDKEISRQNGSLDHLQADIIELGKRLKAANRRGRHIAGR